jgi:hypothetical protein
MIVPAVSAWATLTYGVISTVNNLHLANNGRWSGRVWFERSIEAELPAIVMVYIRRMPDDQR